jgi:opacity protein-like surface antigen
MIIRVLSIAIALLGLGGVVNADEHEGTDDYTRAGFYGAVAASFADPWDLDGTDVGSGVGGRLGARFDQGNAWAGGGIEFWGRAVFTHSNDQNADLVPWSVNVGPIVWFGQGRLQPFARLGMGGSGVRTEKSGSTQNARSIGVSFGTGVEYFVSENLSGYAMFEYESPLTKESNLDNMDTFGGSIGLKYSF